MTPLHHLGEYLRQALEAIPLPFARMLFLALLGGVLLWVLLLPRSETSGSSPRFAENLKLWATLALLIQLAIYWFI